MPRRQRLEAADIKSAVQNGIFVEFIDLEIREDLRLRQLVANPLQIKTARLHALGRECESSS